jgi:uncharacterized membrane protein YwaF
MLNEIQYPITFYSVQHLAFLAVLWPIAVILAIHFSKKYGYTKKVVWSCLILGILCELEKIVFFMEDTGYGFRFPAEHLPFNLCPMQIFFISALAFSECHKKCKVLISFMYPALVGGAFVGMVIPSAAFNFHGLMDFATYRYFFYHAMLIFLGLYLYMSKPIQFSIISFGYAFVSMLIVAIFGVWINAFFGWNPETNFCFLVRPPSEGLPILNMNNGWLGYMAGQMLVCLVLFSLCYLPVFIRDVPKLIKSISGKFNTK